MTADASPHAKFFALSTLQEGLGGRHQAVSVPPLKQACRQEVRQRLFQWLSARAATIDGEESYLRTKLAVVLALLLLVVASRAGGRPKGRPMVMAFIFDGRCNTFVFLFNSKAECEKNV